MNSRVGLIAACTVSMSLVAQAQPAAWPTKPVRVVAPAAPGTPSDQLARVLADRLAIGFGQPVLVDNRPGAGGIIGTQALSRSAPDGHAIGIVGITQFVAAPHMRDPVPYAVERDFGAVRLVAWNYNLLAAPRDSPLRTIESVVAAARNRPGMLSIAMGDVAPPRLAMFLFSRSAGIKVHRIPYKGAPQAAVAALSGEVDLVISAPSVLAPHVTSGRLRALATAAPHRLKAFPELPTFGELGYGEVVIRDGVGFVVPAATPKDVVARLDAEIAAASADPAVRQRIESLGMELANAGPGDFAAILRTESARLGKLVREAGMVIE